MVAVELAEEELAAVELAAVALAASAECRVELPVKRVTEMALEPVTAAVAECRPSAERSAEPDGRRR